MLSPVEEGVEVRFLLREVEEIERSGLTSKEVPKMLSLTKDIV